MESTEVSLEEFKTSADTKAELADAVEGKQMKKLAIPIGPAATEAKQSPLIRSPLTPFASAGSPFGLGAAATAFGSVPTAADGSRLSCPNTPLFSPLLGTWADDTEKYFPEFNRGGVLANGERKDLSERAAPPPNITVPRTPQDGTPLIQTPAAQDDSLPTTPMSPPVHSLFGYEMPPTSPGRRGSKDDVDDGTSSNNSFFSHPQLPIPIVPPSAKPAPALPPTPNNTPSHATESEASPSANQAQSDSTSPPRASPPRAPLGSPGVKSPWDDTPVNGNAADWQKEAANWPSSPGASDTAKPAAKPPAMPNPEIVVQPDTSPAPPHSNSPPRSAPPPPPRTQPAPKAPPAPPIPATETGAPAPPPGQPLVLLPGNLTPTTEMDPLQMAHLAFATAMRPNSPTRNPFVNAVPPPGPSSPTPNPFAAATAGPRANSPNPFVSTSAAPPPAPAGPRSTSPNPFVQISPSPNPFVATSPAPTTTSNNTSPQRPKDVPSETVPSLNLSLGGFAGMRIAGPGEPNLDFNVPPGQKLNPFVLQTANTGAKAPINGPPPPFAVPPPPPGASSPASATTSTTTNTANKRSSPQQRQPRNTPAASQPPAPPYSSPPTHPFPSPTTSVAPFPVITTTAAAAPNPAAAAAFAKNLANGFGAAGPNPTPFPAGANQATPQPFASTFGAPNFPQTLGATPFAAALAANKLENTGGMPPIINVGGVPYLQQTFAPQQPPPPAGPPPQQRANVQQPAPPPPTLGTQGIAFGAPNSPMTVYPRMPQTFSPPMHGAEHLLTQLPGQQPLATGQVVASPIINPMLNNQAPPPAGNPAPAAAGAGRGRGRGASSQGRQFMSEYEMELTETTIMYLKDESINPYRGSVPVERIQNVVRSKHADLYNTVVGTRHNSWRRYVERHLDAFHLFSVEDGKWRMRLVQHENWEEGDRQEQAERQSKEQHLIGCLSLYLEQQSNQSCKVDEFMAAYPTLPQNLIRCKTGDGAEELLHPLPARGDLVRFVRRHSTHFIYDSETLSMVLKRSVNS